MTGPVLSGDVDRPFESARSVREIDLRYLNRPPALNHRPYFPFVASHAFGPAAGGAPVSLLDIGCANGAFLHFVTSRHPRVRCTGIDALAPLAEYAAAHVPAADFLHADISDRESLPTGRYDLVTMLTLHSHFDRLDGWLDNVMRLVAPGGRALLFGPFNDRPVDVLVRLRYAGDRDGAGDGERGWIPGWNVHSRASFAGYLDARGHRHVFHDYAPPADPPVTRAASPGPPVTHGASPGPPVTHGASPGPPVTRAASPDAPVTHGASPGPPADPLSTRVAMLDGRPVLTNDSGLCLPFALLEVLG
ncbi:methyltransferase [Streptosporangium sp. DT93]|uniref:class I SAM-dependent methyltransferase n=1 Tax=Streptosporangium sp. DT93 TaxID=3393428 RepID=UPI003CF3BD5F